MTLSVLLKRSLYITVILFLSITIVFSSNACPRPSCECLGNDVSCEKLNFSKIPWSKIPTWAESISLRQIHNFGQLPTHVAQSLARLVALKHLNISSCIGRIKFDGSWLHHLPSLQVLKISHCQLATVPVFHPAHPGLLSLILNRNAIRRLDANTFRSLPNLRRLEVNFNQLTELRSGWFVRGHPLTVLSANGNQIRRLDPLLNGTLTRLRELRLNRNRMCRLASNSFSAPEPKRNQSSSSGGGGGSGGFPLGGGSAGISLRSRRALPLHAGGGGSGGGGSGSAKPAEECASEVLPALPSVHTLELSRNRIASVQTLTFKGWTSLKVLRLKRNQLRKGALQPGAFYIAGGGLSVLDLTANKNLGRVEYTWLFGNNLKELILSKCGLQDAGLSRESEHQVFSSHTSLERLDLSFNKLSRLFEGQFARLKRLRALSLRGNRLKALPARVFNDLTSLQTLNLADNRLASLAPVDSTSFPRVSALPSSSPFSLYAPRGLFSPLAALRSLDLARNHLRRLTKNDLRGLRALEQLDLRGNNLTRVAPPSAHCPKLRQFLLDSPALTCDCAVAPLLAWLGRSGEGLARHVTANCSRPPALSGRPLVALPPALLGKCEPGASLEPKVIYTGNKTEAILFGANLTLRCEVIVRGIPKAWGEAQRAALKPHVVWERVLPASGSHPAKRQRITGRSDSFPRIAVTQLLAVPAQGDGPGSARWLTLLQLRPGTLVGRLGAFQCEARNAHGRDTSPLITVNVYQLPRFTDSPQPVISTIAGMTVSIPCSAVGHPQPQSALRKTGGLEFPAAKDRRLTIYTGDVQFLIANVQRKDAGDYLCESSNPAGRVFRRFTLRVNEIPSFVKPPRPHAVFTEGQSAVLSCLAAGWPFPSISWSKNGRRLRLHQAPPPAAASASTTSAPLPNSSLAPALIRPRRSAEAQEADAEGLQLANRGQLLVFLNVRPHHAAEYECELLNVVGRKRAQVVVDVSTPRGLVRGGGARQEPPDRQRSRQLTGVIVIAVVVCVVATSLAWVAALYCFRWRKRAAAAAAAAARGAPGGGPGCLGDTGPRARPLLARSMSSGPSGIFMTSSGGFGGLSRPCQPSASSGSCPGLQQEEEEELQAAAARFLLEKHRRLRRDATKAAEDEEAEEGEEGSPQRPCEAATSDYNTGTSSECSANSLCAPSAGAAFISPALPPYVSRQRLTVLPHAPPVSASSPLLPRTAFAYRSRCAAPETVGLTAFSAQRDPDDYV